MQETDLLTSYSIHWVYGALALNMQLTLTIFDGLSIVIGVIDADKGGNIDLAEM